MALKNCCCFSLRTGSLIFLILCLIGAVSSFLTADNSSKIIATICILVFVLGLIAIFTRKPKLLLPTIIWTIFEPIIIFALVVLLGEVLDGIDNSEIPDDDRRAIKTNIFIVMIINTVLYWLTALVVWSYYKKMLEQNANYNANIQVQKNHNPTVVPVQVQIQSIDSVQPTAPAQHFVQ